MRRNALLAVLLPLPIVAVVATLPFSLRAPEEDIPECRAAQTWVDDHAGDLPTTLAEVQHFSLIYQRAIYGALTIEIRRSLWRDHLDQVIRSDYPLTNAQRTFIAGIRDRLPQLITSNPSSKDLSALRSQALDVLGEELGFAVVARLDPVDRELSSSIRRVRDRSACGCNYDSDWCRGNSHCDIVGSCEPTETGCGTLWCYPCNGVCLIS